MADKEESIGALWVKISEKTGDEYYSGEVNGVRVVAFKVKPIEGKANLPAFRIYKGFSKDQMK